jgi:N-methylhydantoinase A
VLRDGAPDHAYEARIDRLPLLLQVFDIRTIGAGGGSIAQADAGLLKVGPASAGAVPGPACYGAGGTRPTVTDAAVVLGLIGGQEFLDGRMSLDADAAATAVGQVAADLGLTVADTAAGIIKVAVARTAGALREITTERGLDPRDFSLLAFGGAGLLLGPIVAREMNMAATVVPREPALFSAWGMLTTDLEYSISHGAVVPLEDADSMATVRKTLAELESAATVVLRERMSEAGQTTMHQQADVRYRGQEFGLSVDVLPADSAESLSQRFAALHQERHGHGIPEHMEVVACRVRGVAAIAKPGLPPAAAPAVGPDPAPASVRPAYDFASGAVVPTPVYRRGDLVPGVTLAGPVIVTEGTATTVVPGDQQLELDSRGLLRIWRKP